MNARIREALQQGERVTVVGHDWTGRNQLRAEYVQQDSSDPSRGGQRSTRSALARGGALVVGRGDGRGTLERRAVALDVEATLIGPGGASGRDPRPGPRQRGGHQTTHLLAGVFQVARLIARDLARHDEPAVGVQA